MSKTWYSKRALQLADMLDVHQNSVWLNHPKNTFQHAEPLVELARFFRNTKKDKTRESIIYVTTGDMTCLYRVVHQFVQSHESLKEDTIFVLYLFYNLASINSEYWKSVSRDFFTEEQKV